jgi:hypothetical protein
VGSMSVDSLANTIPYLFQKVNDSLSEVLFG